MIDFLMSKEDNLIAEIVRETPKDETPRPGEFAEVSQRDAMKALLATRKTPEPVGLSFLRRIMNALTT